jgi:diaminohydroxyphosphoribosylaminopyrimidine deaminase / 5-amino-6-(5-phosphoribosylamino)uracil reductase
MDLSVVDCSVGGLCPGILPGLHPLTHDQSIDTRWAARALELARLADYRTSPNPMVGAVVVDASGELAGDGFHHHKGAEHAEEIALAAAGDRARGGTIYVNLEPCSHAHRRPCCAQAIIAAGVRRAVISMEDPDARVRGRGIAMLQAAGVETTLAVLEAPAKRLNEFYLKHRMTGRPFVTAKFAMSLDGKIATASGESRWITGEAARLHGHGLRHVHDAILVGVNTVILDDPELSARGMGADQRQPVRIVLDSQLRTPAGARVLGPRTILATTHHGTLEGAEVLQLAANDRGRVSLEPLLHELGRREIMSLLLEGGAETHAAFFAAGLVDKVYAYIAPIVIGGRAAPGPVAGSGVEHLADALRLSDTEVQTLAGDFLISGYPDVHRDS